MTIETPLVMPWRLKRTLIARCAANMTLIFRVEVNSRFSRFDENFAVGPDIGPDRLKRRPEAAGHSIQSAAEDPPR